MKKILYCFILVSLCACGVKKENTPITAEQKTTLVANITAHDAYMSSKYAGKYISNVDNIETMKNLPEEFGEMKSDNSIFPYEINVAGAGYSKKYKKIKHYIFADIYTFNAGIKKVPNGIESKELKKMYDETVKEIGETKIYENIEKVDERNATIKGINKAMTFKKYTYKGHDKKNNKDVISSMYLTGYKNSFLKVRISYGQDLKDGDKQEAEFMKNFVNHLEK